MRTVRIGKVGAAIATTAGGSCGGSAVGNWFTAATCKRFIDFGGSFAAWRWLGDDFFNAM